MNHYSFSDLEVGLKETFQVQITEEMMLLFKELTGDKNPLHQDESFAREKGFSSKVCYGMLTASFLSTLGGMYLPGGNCLIQSVDTNFVKPVYIGDTLEIAGTVREKNDTVRQAVLKVAVTNQRGEKVLRGTMKVGVLDEG
ncbi:MAG: MaoC family dehydratase [Bacteroidales bacterium]|nr:MaoC family dehydratase [Bacteroidales bacterium]